MSTHDNTGSQPEVSRRRSRLIALGSTLILAVAGTACSEAEPAPPLPPPVAFEWPSDPDTSLLRQVAKYPKDLDSNSGLFPMSDLPGGELPGYDVTAIGVRSIDRDEVEELFTAGRWALADVRKDKDVIQKGAIPTSVHLEYRHEGFPYKGSTRLTRDKALALLEEHDGIVFFCNGRKCPRSYNASVAAVQLWGLPADRVLWFRDGVPDWTKTPLIQHAQAKAPTVE